MAIVIQKGTSWTKRSAAAARRHPNRAGSSMM